ncbi:hypothetical protein LSM04_008647 [Trypanosoma melophagium]|uniref:uncharacterized protein n=1 Tax=Trypanosoma melophagium TaxID=715481 RepID=UPI003519DE9F|nr:hypothetical protein LSM04_008647 [Trypanosoma melophagium]
MSSDDSDDSDGVILAISGEAQFLPPAWHYTDANAPKLAADPTATRRLEGPGVLRGVHIPPAKERRARRRGADYIRGNSRRTQKECNKVV